MREELPCTLRTMAIGNNGDLESDAGGDYPPVVSLTRLFLSMPAGILGVGADGRILAANPAANRLLGYGRNGLLGSDIALCVPLLGPVRDGLRGIPFRSTLECTMWRRNGARMRAQLCCTVLGEGADAGLGVWFTESRAWPAPEARDAGEESEAAQWSEVRELCWAARVLADGMLGSAGRAELDDTLALSATLEALQRAIGPAACENAAPARRRFAVIPGGNARERAPARRSTR